MIRKVTGIIVSTVDYKESSKIINILTEEEGLIGALAKGCKQLKSKIRVGSNVLILGEFYLKQYGKSLPLVTEVDIITPFSHIRTNLLGQSYALLLLELSSQIVRHEKNNKIYSLLISGLKKIEEGYDAEVITDILELKFLHELGIKPELDCCVSCGKNENIITISSYKGGYLCQECKENEPLYSLKAIKLIRMLYMVDLDKIAKISISEEVKNEIHVFIDDYYDRYSGIYLKSRDFLKKFSKFEFE